MDTADGISDTVDRFFSGSTATQHTHRSFIYRRRDDAYYQNSQRTYYFVWFALYAPAGYSFLLSLHRTFNLYAQHTTVTG